GDGSFEAGVNLRVVGGETDVGHLLGRRRHRKFAPSASLEYAKKTLRETDVRSRGRSSASPSEVRRGRVREPCQGSRVNAAWAKLGFAERSPSREGSGTLSGFPGQSLTPQFRIRTLAAP